MWKKLLTPTLIITLVALFALTWYCSIKAEEYFALWVERSNYYAPVNTTNELVSYERRFFTAEAITTVDMTDLGRYDFHHLIRHYAWGVTMITTPVADSTTSPLLEGLRIVTDVGPTGSARSRLSLPQLTAETDIGTVTIDRIAGELRMNATATEGSWDISLDQLLVVDDAFGRLIIAGINSSADMNNLAQFPLGENRTRINSLTLATADGRSFVINGLNIDGTNFLDQNQRYGTRSAVSFNRMQAGDSIVTDGQMGLALNDLDTRVIEALMSARNRLRHHLGGDDNSFDELNEEIFLPAYRALLQSGATVLLEEVALATPGGQLHGTGHATLHPGMTTTDFNQLLDQIELELLLDFDVVILARINQLMQHMQGSPANISTKEEELRMIFGGLVQLGFLSRLEGDRFRLLFSYDDGEIKLNDQPFRLF
ncbi:MAG: DUF945 family protein [Pelovirga sp.]